MATERCIGSGRWLTRANFKDGKTVCPICLKPKNTTLAGKFVQHKKVTK